jgi:hypothetical protein
MSKGGGSKPAPVKEDKGPNNFVTGIQPYPKSGQFPIVAAENYWDGANFKMPGIATPLMSSDLLTRFPQLATLFGGQTPPVQTDSFAPTLAGLPPTFGTTTPNPVLNPEKDKGRGKKDKGPHGRTATV